MRVFWKRHLIRPLNFWFITQAGSLHCQQTASNLYSPLVMQVSSFRKDFIGGKRKPTRPSADPVHQTTTIHHSRIVRGAPLVPPVEAIKTTSTLTCPLRMEKAELQRLFNGRFLDDFPADITVKQKCLQSWRQLSCR